MESQPLPYDRLKKDGSNADVEVNIGSEDFVTTGTGTDKAHIINNPAGTSYAELKFNAGSARVGTVTQYGNSGVAHFRMNSNGSVSLATDGVVKLLVEDALITLSVALTSTNTGTFGEIVDSGLDAAAGVVYSTVGKQLTSTAPATGAIGYWTRTATAVYPTTVADDFIVGSIQITDQNDGVAGDSRMFFDIGRSAFRAGNVNAAQWDTLGLYSVAIGVNCSASGDGCIALGNVAAATNVNAIAIGPNTVASAERAVAVGYGAEATATDAYAIGTNVDATAVNAIAIGHSFVNNLTESIALGIGATDFLLTATTLTYTGTSYFGTFGGGNYAKFADDGELTLFGTARVTKGIVIGSGSFHKGSSAPGDGFINGIVHTLDFDQTTTQHGHYNALVPHDIAAGTNITIECDWFFDDVEADHYVTWEVQYLFLADGEDPATAPTTIFQKSVISTGNNDKQIHTTFGTALTGAVADDTFLLRFSRDSDATNDTDDLAQDARLLAIHLHYTSDKLGQAT